MIALPFFALTSALWYRFFQVCLTPAKKKKKWCRFNLNKPRGWQRLLSVWQVWQAVVFLINLTSLHLFPVASCWDGKVVECALLNIFLGTNAATDRYSWAACSPVSAYAHVSMQGGYLQARIWQWTVMCMMERVVQSLSACQRDSHRRDTPGVFRGRWRRQICPHISNALATAPLWL